MMDLREELHRANLAHDSFQQSVQQQLGDMRQALWLTEEQTHWIAWQEWKLDGCGEESLAILTWSFRQLPPVETVLVEVRPADEMGWHTAASHSIGRLSYQSEMLLDGRVEWEYRIVVEGPDGSRATDPQVVDAFAQLRRQELIFYQGETVDHEGSTWISFVLQNMALDLNPCTAIARAELELTHSDGTFETIPMQVGRSDAVPGGPDPSARGDRDPHEG